LILTAAERSHFSVLGVDLRDISDPIAEYIDRHIVAVLVLEVGCLVSRPLNLRLAIG
jgi:hypothetical protein